MAPTDPSHTEHYDTATPLLNGASKAQPEVKVVELDEDSDEEIEEIFCDSEPTKRRPTPPPQCKYALSVQASGPASFGGAPSSFQQQTKDEDDSAIAFGDSAVNRLGDASLSVPPPSAPEADDEILREYEAWLACNQLSLRRKFAKHDEWQVHLESTGRSEGAVLAANAIPHDDISARFKARAMAGLADGLAPPPFAIFASQSSAPAGFNQYAEYVPPAFLAQAGAIKPADAQAAWRARSGLWDDVALMMAAAAATRRSGSSNPARTVVPAGRAILVSDHNGGATGRKFEVWGPGNHPSFTGAGMSSGQNLNIVAGTTDFDVQTAYEHVHGRFSIVRIEPNEVGFCLCEGTVLRMSPGRYFLNEALPESSLYLGKAAALAPSSRHERLQPHSKCQSDAVRMRAAQLTVVWTAPGDVAFFSHSSGPFAIGHSGAVAVVNEANAEAFVSHSRLSRDSCVAADGSYAIINLCAGQFVLFGPRAENGAVLWHHDASDDRCNTLHLRATEFELDLLRGAQGTEPSYRLCSVSDRRVKAFEVEVFSNQPGEFAVLQDDSNRVKFVEHATDTPIVLRPPWKLHATGLAQSETQYQARQGGAGRSIFRLRLTASQWAAVVTQEGNFRFLPPLLTGAIYYLAEPEQRFVGVIDRYKEGVQRHDVPGIGEVSIANISTGALGVCRRQGVYCFLNPSIMRNQRFDSSPYVFVHPDMFVEEIDIAAKRYQYGDLHRVVLRPDERAVVSKDGEPLQLPRDAPPGASAGNGVYHFRSNQLEIYGPVKKTEQYSELGPYIFFNVPVGEVAFGYDTEDGLRIWERGSHCLSIDRGQRFGGFFAINVDPIEIANFHILSKHSISSHLDFFITYRINDARAAIEAFGGSHENVHRFVENSSKDVMLNLCQQRPPLGFCDGDFDAHVATSKCRRSSHADASHIDGTETPTEAGDSRRTNTDEMEHEMHEVFDRELAHYGIVLDSVKITSWRIDPQFQEAACMNARKLQDARAKIEQERLELEQGLLVIQRKDQDMQLLALDRENCNKEAVATAERQAGVAKAQAHAEADRQMVATQATQDTRRREAETSRLVSEEKQEQAKVENRTAMLQAEAEAERAKLTAMAAAETTVAAEMAERRARQAADLEVAQVGLQTAKAEAEMRQLSAQTRLDVAKLDAEAKRLAGEADAENASRLAAAKFAFLGDDSAKLQAFLAEQMVHAMPHMPQTQTVRHCLDAGDKPDAQQLMPLLLMQQAMGTPTRGGATDGASAPAMMMASMMSGLGQTRTPQ